MASVQAASEAPEKPKPKKRNAKGAARALNPRAKLKKNIGLRRALLNAY